MSVEIGTDVIVTVDNKLEEIVKIYGGTENNYVHKAVK
jgi:hypothetical protein